MKSMACSHRPWNAWSAGAPAAEPSPPSGSQPQCTLVPYNVKAVDQLQGTQAQRARSCHKGNTTSTAAKAQTSSQTMVSKWARQGRTWCFLPLFCRHPARSPFAAQRAWLRGVAAAGSLLLHCQSSAKSGKPRTILPQRNTQWVVGAPSGGRHQRPRLTGESAGTTLAVSWPIVQAITLFLQNDKTDSIMKH